MASVRAGQTSEHSKEIGQLSSAESNVRAAAQRLSDLASKGILTVSPGARCCYAADASR